MSKPVDPKSKNTVLAFASEAEEAAWWFKNREQHRKHLAAKSGDAVILTQERLRERLAAAGKRPTQVISLRIPEADLALARKQAEQKGLPYQTYIKSLLHETLISRAKRKAG